MRFSELTAVRRVDTDHFELDIDPSSFIVRGPNGGYLAAVLLRAMTERVDDPSRSPRSLTVHYPAAPSAGPATVSTDVVRQGRSLSTVTARLEQDGRPMAVALAAFSSAWPGPAFAERPMPIVPRYGETEEVERPVPLPFLDYWEERFAIGPLPWSASPLPAESGGWLRLREPEPIDAVVVAAMADAWPPAVFTRFAAPNPVPTVDLTIHFRTTLPSVALGPEDPVLVRFATQTLADGFLEEDGELWAPDGTLIAQSRQLAILLPG